jgi:CheY-like chemotaxis protein
MSKIILCADDSATMQKVAEITFRGSDYTYVGARSIEEALEKARAQKPALVLADAVMGSKSGYDLCQSLKTDGALGDIPVVILCGNSAPYDAARGSAVGADATFTKPWDTQVMLDKITEILDKAAQHGVAKASGGGAAAAAPAPATPAPAAPKIGAAPTMPSPTVPATPPAPAPVSPAAAAAAAAKAPPAAQMPPRSATIMGMPTIKMPPGPGGTAQPVPLSTAPTPGMPAPISAPTIKPPATPAPVAPAPAARSPFDTAPKAPLSAPTPAPRAANPTPAPPTQPAASSVAAVGRPPMIAGVPTKRSALVERTLAKMAARLAEASGLEPGSPELIALLKLSTEVVERIVWEVVPELAETIIRENLHELAAKRAN